ncbi:SDR family oxidoreductase [Rhodovibrionaceae bacterium A322]
MAQKVLLSGASGFIGSHTVERLLSRGHEVVGTVRNPSDSSKVSHLQALAGAEDRLSLVPADLTDEDPFSDYMDVDVVMHVASPYVLNVKDPQRDLVDPAVKGTLSMLRAAAGSSRIKRVIVTSSMAAVTDEPDGRVLTEKDWNSKSSLSRNPYFYSKVRSEQAAWKFMEEEKPAFDLVVINPHMVTGPSMTADINTSNQNLIDIVSGQYPAVIDMTLCIVDVRDVADAHVAAMETPEAEGRYLCSSGTMTIEALVALLRKEGYGHCKLPKFDWTGPWGTRLMKLLSYTQPSGIGTVLRTHIGRDIAFDNNKIIRDLGMNFRSPAESVIDTLADLSKWGHIPAPKF